MDRSIKQAIKRTALARDGRLPATGVEVAIFATSKNYSVLIVLLAVLFGAYSPSIVGPYAFDDLTLLETLKNANLSQLSWLRPETRPLVSFSFVVEAMCFGSSPAVHRLGNVIIHSLAAWILFDLVRLLRGRTDGDAPGVGHISPAVFGLLVAGVWALHPLQTESVAYIVQRGESLMGLFYFAFLNAIARYHGSGKSSWGWVAVICFVAGLWSKTVMVTALAVAPLMDRAFFCDSWKQVLRKAGWIYLPPIVLGMFAAIMLMPGIMRGEANVGFGGYAPPVHLYLAAQAEMVWRYLALSIWPVNLCIDYGLHPPASITSQSGWVLLTVSLIAAGLYFYIRRDKVTGFCVLAPLLVLSITSSVVPTADLLVEHRMYVPLAAVAAAVVMLLERVVQHYRHHEQQRWLCLVAILAMLVLGARTYVRAADYASGEALWSGAVAISPDNDRAIQNLMHAVGREREAEVIIPQLVDAVRKCEQSGLNPRVPLQRLGELLVRAGAFAQAEPLLLRAIELDEQSKGKGYRDLHRDRDRAAAHVNLALAQAARNDLNTAYLSIASGIEHFDLDANARALAGDFARKLGRTDEARTHFQRALELHPQWPQVVADLATLEATPN